MIRGGRPVLDRLGVGEAHGLSQTQAVERRPWAQPGHPAPINRPGGRKGGLWDAEQVRAYAAGETVPALPDQDAPDDLLDAAEFGELAGIAATTVLRYVLRETIVPAADEVIYGQPHWRRQTIEDWLPNRPGRGAGGGRRNSNGLTNEELLERAAAFREEATSQGRSLGVRELGRLLEVSPTKASRILAALPAVSTD